MATFTIQVDEVEIKNGILSELIAHLFPLFQRASANSLIPVKRIIRDEIVSSNEYQQMLPGSRFYHELGIPDIEHRLNKVIDTILDSIEVKVVPPYLAGDNIYGTYSISILKRDFSDVLALSEAKFEYVSKRYPMGHTLDWLSWILLSGSNNIILDFHFAPVTGKEQSRTGMGLMFKGGSWGVQPFLGGTLADNFLTRAANRISYEVIKTLEKEFLILDS